MFFNVESNFLLKFGPTKLDGTVSQMEVTYLTF